MADYFRRLASAAADGKLAIVDPTTSSAPPKQYTYAQLLTRVNVFHDVLAAKAQEAGKPLQGARVGLMVPPGVDFVAALLAVWTAQAIVGMGFLGSRA